MKRIRTITPYRLAISMAIGFATRKVETIADIHRFFNSIHNLDVAYRSFYDQLVKPSFSHFMREFAQLALEKLTMQTLAFQADSPFAEFEQIIIQDGSSFAIKEALQEVFPGRFKTIKPAAVELHVSMDLLRDSPVKVVLTPDTASERAYLPEPELLMRRLLLGDRGYPDLSYLQKVSQHGGYFLMRAKSDMNPEIVSAWLDENQILDTLCGRKLKDIRKIPKHKPVDLDVKWRKKKETIHARMIVTWNSNTKEFQYLITNLPREKFSVQHVGLAYKLRWQIELLFKELKSYANLHAFDTEDPDIVEGLIWAGLVAAILKRFIAHATQQIAKVAISTRKCAMCIADKMLFLMQALLYDNKEKILNTFIEIVEFLSKNAIRSHPKRERQKGRSQLGLEPVW